MKKYIKPAIEIVEANLSTNCMLGANSQEGYGEQLSSGKKDKGYDDEDDSFSAGW